jgi:flagellar protein FlgJ
MNFAIKASGALAPTSAATPATALEHRKLADAAQQFEGMLLQEILKPMKEHGFCQRNEEDASDDKDMDGQGGDTLSSFGVETMANAIAKGGGLGIAKHVVAQVESEKTLRGHRGTPEFPEIPK